MKLPNGYGSVYKLSGKRRNPWVARKTVGWILDTENKTAKQKYHVIGYFPSRKDALTALAKFNEDPYDLHYDTITFEEVYNLWSRDYFETISNENAVAYKAAFRLCTVIKHMKMADIKLAHLQAVVDASGKNTPSLKKLKILFSQVFDYAVKHEIVPPSKKDLVSYVDINKPGNPNSIERIPFSAEEIKILWEHADNPHVSIFLILIYTGLRIGELLELEKINVHLPERWVYIKEAKTTAGIREVPIAEKIAPLVETWMSSPGDYLIASPTGKNFAYANFMYRIWKPIIKELGISEHRPHDTRHTCISLLVSAEVDDRIVKKIVGHKGVGITETVYTHVDMPKKLEAINRI